MISPIKYQVLLSRKCTKHSIIYLKVIPIDRFL